MDTAILLITHDMGVVADMADDVMVMYAGEVVEYAPVRELFHGPLHPYTQGLLRSLPRLDQDIDLLYTIEGTVPPASQEMPGCRFAERCPECRAVCRGKKPPMIQMEKRQVRCHKYDQGGEWDG
jgi:peptide/nickel transport system ATP-binding protein/oligopeptide transport system ATP-binding protein